MTIEGLKKHVGKLDNTGVRVAVVFRKIPSDEDFCLIVETERLPDSYHDELIQILNSKESLDTSNLYEVLNRRSFPDGSNCLLALHQRGFLRKEPISNVTMIPLSNQFVPLSTINDAIDGNFDKLKNQARESELDSASGDPMVIAKGLLQQAEDLDKQAEQKRQEAYRLAPVLIPTRGKKDTPEEIRQMKHEERKLKRRERDQKKLAESKILLAEADNQLIEKQIADKIERAQSTMNQSHTA